MNSPSTDAAAAAVQSLATLVVSVAIPPIMDELTAQGTQLNRTIAVMQETMASQSRQLKAEQEARAMQNRTINELRKQVNDLEGMLAADRRSLRETLEVANSNFAEIERHLTNLWQSHGGIEEVTAQQAGALTEVESRVADLEQSFWPTPTSAPAEPTATDSPVRLAIDSPVRLAFEKMSSALLTGLFDDESPTCEHCRICTASGNPCCRCGAEL